MALTLSFFIHQSFFHKPSVEGRDKASVMKKLLFSLVLLVAATVAANAQSTQVATLSHDGVVTSFTSARALQQAYKAAVDGDVITLSSGSFNAVNFEKRITVRGAGMGIKVNDSDPYIEPTMLVGDFYIKADKREDNIFKLEGILSENVVVLQGVVGAQFSKCRFKDLSYAAGYGGFENATFIHCVFDGKASICFNATMNFYGCYLKNTDFQAAGSHHDLINCILEIDNSGNLSNFGDAGCVVKNSIYVNNKGYEYCQNKGNAFNSIWTGIYNQHYSSSFTFKDDLEAHNNAFVPEGVTLFKEGTFFQLTDEAKQYLGDDGTEVGIYGGSLPFDPTPTNPQITKFNVAPKTTADGKLSVDIEVNVK